MCSGAIFLSRVSHISNSEVRFGREVEIGYLKVLCDVRVIYPIRVSVTRIMCWHGGCQDERRVACGIGVMLL